MPSIWRKQPSGRVSSGDQQTKIRYGASAVLASNYLTNGSTFAVDASESANATSSCLVEDLTPESRVRVNNIGVTASGAAVYVNYEPTKDAVANEAADAEDSTSCVSAAVADAVEYASADSVALASVLTLAVATDSTTAGDTLSGTTLLGGSVSEAGSASEATSALAVFNASTTDAASALSDQVASAVFSVSASGSTTATDTAISFAEWNASVAEATLSVDSSWCLRIVNVTMVAAASATDRSFLLEPVYPLPSQVAAGVYYGPHGDDYIGTATIASGLMYDIASGELVKPLGGKRVMTL